jgi:hypothetical protein
MQELRSVRGTTVVLLFVVLFEVRVRRGWLSLELRLAATMAVRREPCACLDQLKGWGVGGECGWGGDQRWQWRGSGGCGQQSGSTTEARVVDVSSAAPQGHRIINVALYREYSLGIIFIFSQGRKDLNHV